MKDESTFNPDDVLGGVLIGFLLCAIAFGVREEFHNRAAIRRGHAYYSVDPLSGITTFTWKTSPSTST